MLPGLVAEAPGTHPRRRRRMTAEPATRPSRVVVAMSGGVDSSVAAALVASSGAERSACRCSCTTSATAPRARRFGSCCTLDDLARCAPRRRGDRHSALRHELRAAVRGSGHRQLRWRVRRRPHSPALRALQQRPQIRDAARTCPRPRRRTARHRPLRTRRARRGRRAGIASGAASTRPRTSRTSCSRSTRRSCRARSFPVG